MFSFLSLSRRFGREVHSGRGKRQPCRPRLEVLEDRTVPAFWTTVTPMGTARKLLAGTLGSDGRIYVIGGANAAFTILNTVECYSPTLNKWTNVAPMPTARQDPAAAVGPNGRLLVMGGFTAGGTALATVESYNPNTDTWST